MRERRSGEPQRDQGKYEGWIPSAIAVVVIGLVAGGVRLDRAIDEAGDRARQEIIDNTVQDGFEMVPNSNGDVLLRSGGDSVHIALGNESCSAWVTVVKTPEDQSDPQSYAMRIDERDYYFTDHASMLAILGEDFCSPVYSGQLD